MPDYIVKTWKEIAKYTPFSTQTLIRNYGHEMLERGVVHKNQIGRAKRTVVWAFPSQIIKYFTIKSQNKYNPT